MQNVGGVKNEISLEDIRDANSKVHNMILYIYSMETFIPYTLNKASRD